jgi:virginiamycin B lyase
MHRRAILLSLALVLAWPAAAGAEPVDISEWLVPWEKSTPRDPYVDQRGRVWFVGQRGDYVANLTPESGEFSRYDLDRGTGPHNLIVSPDGLVWYAGNRNRHIGQLNPATGRIQQFEMPDRSARDPHTLVFDADGNIWFTVQQGNFVGKLTVATGGVELIDVPVRKARPYGIVINSRGVPWVVAFGSNHLLRIDPASMSITEIELPDRKARPRRLVTSSDDRVWWADYERGYLGRYDPVSAEFSEWAMPGGEDSEPYAMAIDRDDRIWIVESGLEPNRLVGFDPRTGSFFSQTDIPSGGGSVRHMHYFEPAGELWFGTDTNYIGRASIH